MGDTKQVVLCDAEKAEILHLFPVEYPASCMHWMEVQDDSRSEFLHRDDPFSFCIDYLFSFIWFIFCSLAHCPHSASLKMSPVVFFQSYPLYLKGETLSFVLSTRQLNEKYLGHSLVFIFCNCFYCFSIFLCVMFVFSYSTTSKIFR